MKHVSLFSGIGGFNLACEWLGIPTILNCEIDDFCQKVLNKHWPDVPIVKDVNNVKEIKRIVADSQSRESREPTQRQGREDSGRGDSLILSAGFPCQPFSNAGRKRGANDDRYLWPQTLAVIEAIRPDFIVLENVAGLLNMVFPDSGIEVDRQTSLFEDEEIGTGSVGSARRTREYDTIIGAIMDNLRTAGYQANILVIPACAIGAPHRRDRVWIVAHANNSETARQREHGRGILREPKSRRFNKENSNGTDAFSEGLEVRPRKQNERGTIRQERSPISKRKLNVPGWQENWYEVATRFCRVDARVPDRVDRLKALGNAIVPGVAYQVIKSLVHPEMKERYG